MKILLTHTPQMRAQYYGERALADLRGMAEVLLHEAPDALQPDELVAAAQDADFIIADRLTTAPASIFPRLPGLKAFLRCAVDIRNIDVDAASAAGILVTRARPGFVESVTELTLGFLVDLSRGVSRAAADYRAGRKPEVLGRLKALARWRELEAQGKNLPRGRIMKDETLADLAGSPPRKQADLARVRGLSAAWAGNDIGGRLMDALEAARPMSGDELPARDDRKPGLGKEGGLIADLLKLLLKIRAREIDVAPKLLARSDDLEALAAGKRDGLAILEGWRFEQFGHDALDLVEGRLGFGVKNGKLKMTRTEEA